jgi:type I restriction enzyme, S subunit
VKYVWQKKRLSEVTTKIGSGATPRGGGESYKSEGISLIRSLNVYDDGFRDAKLARIDDEQADDLGNVIIESHDVLLNITGASVARCCRAPADYLPARVNQHVSIIRPAKEKLDSDFLQYLLISKDYKDRLLNTGEEGGSTRQAITKAQLQEFVIEFPDSLAEQRRIVGLLDEAFEGIATAKANAEKNLQNARALFESHLQSVFTQRGPGWVRQKLKLITTKIGSGATPRGGGESYKAQGVSLIRSLNVHDFGFKYAKLAFLDDRQADELSNVVVRPRDVLLNITGASVARCTIVPEDVLPARVNQHVSIIRPAPETLDADFLHYLLVSKPYKDQLLKTGDEGGSTRQAITKAQIQDFVVDYPLLLSDQNSIVTKLDAILAETQRLTHLYGQKLAALDELKKSLLHQAFSGAL